jgi:hypothetical protein
MAWRSAGVRALASMAVPRVSKEHPCSPMARCTNARRFSAYARLSTKAAR